jgi:Integrase core domain
MSSDRSTRHGGGLAPQSFRLVLDQEITSPPRKTGGSCGDSRLDSVHEPSEPAVGSTPHSRRTTQVGDQGGVIDGGQISAPTRKAAFADLASLPGKSCGTDGFHRLLHSSDRDLPGSVCVCGTGACSTPRAALLGDGTPDPGVDQQIREACPWEQVPRYLLRDRDAIYGRDFAALTKDMGMEEVVNAPRAPWQNPYVERLVGSIRRECLDHVIVWNQRSLRRILKSYFAYYQHSRTHFSLGQRCARASDRGTAGPGSCVCDSSGRRTPSPIPASRCLVNPKRPTPTLGLLTWIPLSLIFGTEADSS